MKTGDYPMYVVFYDGDAAVVLKRRDGTAAGMPIYEPFEIYEDDLSEAGRRALELMRAEKEPKS